jgi:hypothetical protein
MLAAYEADPSLAPLRLDFVETVQQVPPTILAGTLARAWP